MAANPNPSQRRTSNSQLLEELEALSQSLYQTNHCATSLDLPRTNRRATSLDLPRDAVIVDRSLQAPKQSEPKFRSHRMSLSPWQSRPGAEKSSSNSQLLEELEPFSQSLYHNHTNRRTTSLDLPRDAVVDKSLQAPKQSIPKSRSHRMSLSPWWSRPGAEKSSSNSQLLEELEDLSQSPYHNHTNRRATSLDLPRDAVIVDKSLQAPKQSKPKSRSHQMSLSPWRSRPGAEKSNTQSENAARETAKKLASSSSTTARDEKKGIWNWKPMRALSHIGMQKLGCLFSVEVVSVQGLPASMNGLRLFVCVRKKETKDGSVQTMPSRVLQGAADFEETLFINCHVYYTSGGEKQLKFEPRPFLIYVKAIDAQELDFGRNLVDLCRLVQESMEKNQAGTRIRQWDTSFGLAGKAKGGELVLKLGFQIMEEKGVGIYSHGGGALKSGKSKDSSPLVARKQSKYSFSAQSPKLSSRFEALTPSSKAAAAAADLQGIDDLDLDEPDPVPVPVQKPDQEPKIEDLDLPDFEVVDKGVEIEKEIDDTKESSEEEGKSEISVSSEVVKEVVHDQAHQKRLTELDSIAQQIKALESIIQDESSVKTEQETAVQGLDADEETVTREFLHMLEEEEDEEEGKGLKLNLPEIPSLQLKETEENTIESDSKAFVPDLGKGLGPVVQTRDGGYLAAMNPFDTEVLRKETPKLAMQVSKPVILSSANLDSGIEIFQKMAGKGVEELTSHIQNLAGMDELMGKTAEQIAFEGIASAIIQGRNTEGASSSAARSIAAVKAMVAAMSAGRKERISTGIWNVSEEPVTVDEILPFSLQKIEAMAVEALKIQAEMAEEEAPFNISPAAAAEPHSAHILSSARALDDWAKNGGDLSSKKGVTLMMVVQLRDPVRRYEAVGGPVVVLAQATRVDASGADDGEEGRFKVGSLHVGGLKVRSGGRRHVWDVERQKLTGMQWLLGYGVGKAGKKGRHVQSKGPQDSLWSISARVMADMWLKPMRNPEVKFHDT